MATGRRDTVQSFDRGLGLLESFAADKPELGLNELSRRLGLSKGTVARLLTTALRRGYIARDPDTAKYRLGIRTWEIGCRAVAQLGIRETARAVIEHLHAATQETVHLTVLSDDGHIVFLDRLDSTNAIRVYVPLGGRAPAWCVASGKVLLGHRSIRDRESLIPRRLKPFTEKTVTSRRELDRILDRAREHGYAVNRGEWRRDVSGVAAPVRNYSGEVIAAVGVTLPTSRMTDEVTAELVPLVTKAAHEISSKLGFAGAHATQKEDAL